MKNHNAEFVKNQRHMIKEHHFKFEELDIDRTEIDKVLGYQNEELPEPFLGYLDMAYELALTLTDIAAVVKTIDDIEFLEDKEKISVAGIELHVGRQIRHELKNSTQAAFFICTAGAKISTLSKKLMKDEDPILGFIYDTMGSFIAEAAGDKMQDLLQTDLESQNLKLTNRFSPGYCNWPVSDQHNLFSFFNGKTVDVNLSESSLMYPIKSISGIIGIGENVRYREYQCEMCNNKTCIYRNLKR